MMSGRLTPAAATSISTSPAPGMGTGRMVCFSISGPPPGAVISIAIMVAGRADMASFLWTARSIAPLAGSRHTGNRPSDEEKAMDEEDLLPRQKRPAKKDLTPLAIAELEAEIARARDEISAKRKQRGGADALFKR